MLDYYEFVDRWERLPANEVTRAIRMQSETAAAASTYGTPHAFACLRQFIDRWGRRRDATEYEAPGSSLDDPRADGLLESIENSQVDIRFVPDWGDESFKTAA